MRTITHENLHDLINSNKWVDKNASSLVPGGLLSKGSSGRSSPLAKRFQQRQQESSAENLNLPSINKSRSMISIEETFPFTEYKVDSPVAPHKSVKEWLDDASVDQLTRFFNHGAEGFNSFAVKAETLLYKMEKQASLVQSKPPYAFQTVLASSILWKLATQVLPTFKKILVPVANYLFKAIYIDFEPLSDLDPSDSQLNSELFQKYATYHFTVKDLQAYKKRMDARLSEFKVFDSKKDTQIVIKKKLVDAILYQFNSQVKRRVFKAFCEVVAKGKLGNLETQRDYIKNKQRSLQLKEVRTQVFGQWQLFVALKKLIREKDRNDKVVKRENDALQRCAATNDRLKRAESEIEKLRGLLKQRDEFIKEQDREMKQIKQEMYLKTPKLVGFCLETYHHYFKTTPFVQRIKKFNSVQFNQLESVWTNPLVQYILYPRVRDPPQMNMQKRKTLKNMIQQHGIVQKSGVSKKRTHWYLQNLLSQKEQLFNGGLGVSHLLGCTMGDVVIRWSFMMIEYALNKLRPVIEILEDQLVNMHMKVKSTRSKWLINNSDTIVRKESDEENSPEPLYKKVNPIVASEQFNQQALTNYLQNCVPSQILSVKGARDLLAHLKHLYTQIKEPYVNYNLRSTATVNIDLPQFLISIIHAIDSRYKLVILDRDGEKNSVWTELKYRVEKQNSQEGELSRVINKKTSEELLGKMLKHQSTSRIPSKDFPNVYQIPDLTMLNDFFELQLQTSVDEQQQGKKNQLNKRLSIIPAQAKSTTGIDSILKKPSLKNIQNMDNYKRGLDAMRDFSLANQTLNQYLYIKKTIETITQVDLSQFINTSELTGAQQFIDPRPNKIQPDSALATLLQFLMMFRSRLDMKPQEKINLKNDNREELVHEQHVSDTLFDKIMCNVFQTIHIPILKTVNGNIQDMNLLCDGKMDIIDSPVDEIKLRWINYQLARTFKAMREKEEEIQKQFDKLKNKEAEVRRGSTLDKRTSISNQVKEVMELQKTKSPRSPKRPPPVKTSYAEEMFTFKPIKDILALLKNNYNYLIVLLATLCPEAVWQYFRMDQVTLTHNIDILMLIVAIFDPEQSACAKHVQKMLKINQSKDCNLNTALQVGLFLAGSFQCQKKDEEKPPHLQDIQRGMIQEFRCLFIINSVKKITQKTYLMDIDHLIEEQVTKQSLNEILTELFLNRPRLTTFSGSSSTSFQEHVTVIKDFLKSQKIFLQGAFDKQKMDTLQAVFGNLQANYDKVMEAFRYLNETQQAYTIICRKMKDDQSENLGNFSLAAQQQGLIRSSAYFCILEGYLNHIDIDLLKRFISFESDEHAKNWQGHVQEAITIFKLPIRRLMNSITDDYGMVNYLQLWHFIKQINFKGLNPVNEKTVNLKLNKIELMLTQIAVYLQKKVKNESIILDQEEQTTKKKNITALKKQLSVPVELSRRTSNITLTEMMLRKVSKEAGLKNTTTNIKSHLLPQNAVQQDIFLERRILYDLNVSASEAIAVLFILIFNLKFTEILEFFLGGAPDVKPGQSDLLLFHFNHLEKSNSKSNPSEMRNNFSKEQKQLYRQYDLQKIILEQTTNQCFGKLKSQLDQKSGPEKTAKLLELMKDGIIGGAQNCYPQAFITIVTIKCILSHKTMMNTLQRYQLMSRATIQTILTFYKPLLIALFEYYLYQSYTGNNNAQLQESCLPLSALTEFYYEFAQGESARLNKTTMTDMLQRIFEQNAEMLDQKYEPVEQTSPECKKRKVFSMLAEKKEKPVEKIEKGIVTFSDFVEIVFEISQEINGNKNTPIAQKLKDYIERVLMLGIRYRLSSDEDSLHRKRLSAEVERVRTSSQIRQAAKDISLTNYLDLV